jgi:hypothetical protein
MLSEFALSPSVFRIASYESATVAELCIRQIAQALREDCIVRDLCSGEWSAQLDQQKDVFHVKAKELLKNLKKGNRLACYPRAGPQTPDNDPGWEAEAILSHGKRRLTGCVFSQPAKQERYKNDPLVSCPEKLLSAPFWTARSCSRRISRSINAYMDLLAPVLLHANSIMFIDPHLDPSQKRYSDFWKLITPELLTNRVPKPRIEIHRVAWTGDGRDKQPRVEQIKTDFRNSLEACLKDAVVAIDVFLWDDFHDRFLLTELLGTSWSNGFDINEAPSSSVTVTRLSRSDRDEVQNEFTANSTRHHLQGRFKIGS